MEFKTKTRHGRPPMKNETLDFDKESERWAIKLYSKSENIKTKIGALPEHAANYFMIIFIR
jgi:II/X family phage/plasmid replication protein